MAAGSVAEGERECELHAVEPAELGGDERRQSSELAEQRIEVGIVVAVGHKGPQDHVSLIGGEGALALGWSGGKAGVGPRPQELSAGIGVDAGGAVEPDEGAGLHDLIGAGVGDGTLVAAEDGDGHVIGVAHSPLVGHSEGQVDFPLGVHGDLGRGERHGGGVGVHQLDGGPAEGNVLVVYLEPAVGQGIAVSIGAGAGDENGAPAVGAASRAVFGGEICGGRWPRGAR